MGQQLECREDKGLDFDVELSGSILQGLASHSGPCQAPQHHGASWILPGDLQTFSLFFYSLIQEQGVREKERTHSQSVCVCVCVCACVYVRKGEMTFVSSIGLIAKIFSNLVANFKWNVPSSCNPTAKRKCRHPQKEANVETLDIVTEDNNLFFKRQQNKVYKSLLFCVGPVCPQWVPCTINICAGFSVFLLRHFLYISQCRKCKRPPYPPYPRLACHLPARNTSSPICLCCV